MTVSKEMIKDLNILSMSVAEIPCVLNKYNKGELLFTLLSEDSKNHFNNEKNCNLILCIQESDSLFNSETATLEIEEYGIDWIVAKINNCTSPTLNKLLNQLSCLETQEEKYGRRKEPRIKIGKEKYTNFGLTSAEHKVFSKTSKVLQPCAIIDVSIHGICIITPFENPVFKTLENFFVQLSFQNPEQTVILQCHKVHTKLSNTGSRIFATISCQLLEPINYIWKERVMKLIENEAAQS